jgi:hypothetical protein
MTKRKIVKDVDLTQGGLFPANWSCIGFGWRKKKDRKKSVRSNTPGSTKGDNCKATPFARFCAKKARARKHLGYATQLEAWRSQK